MPRACSTVLRGGYLARGLLVATGPAALAVRRHARAQLETRPVKVRGIERTPARRLKATGRPDRPSRLPLNGFAYFLTLSSKCFSTFPHGTCLLSVS